MASKVLFILGAGSNVGHSVAARFHAAGYNVAISSRSVKPGPTAEGYLGVPLDLSDPSHVSAAFDTVIQQYGVPTVVVYNAASHIPSPSDDPFRLSQVELASSLQINLLSAYEAARLTIIHTEKLRKEGGKVTFIFTGNALNRIVLLGGLALGVGKQASAHFVAVAAAAYANKGARFYYADELTPQHEPVYFDINGEAHAIFFEELVQAEHQGPWLATFVKGKGYEKV